ncbi:MAG: diheme cytochrome c [Chromatiales bacterium]
MKNFYKLSAIVLAAVAVAGCGQVMGDDDGSYFSRWSNDARSGVPSKASKRYVEECGGCHFPYQPGLLPAQSWEGIMSGLADHFGESAELPDEDAMFIRKYLLDNAAGRVHAGLPNRIMGSQGDRDFSLRITETRFFRHEHNELPKKLVQENQQVRSFSNCNACHTRAMQGSYNEHEIKIPGYGHWDD